MPTDLGMSSTLNSDYMPYMKEPSLHLSDEPLSNAKIQNQIE